MKIDKLPKIRYLPAAKGAAPTGREIPLAVHVPVISQDIYEKYGYEKYGAAILHARWANRFPV
jgi:hypothetical protein